MIGRVLSHYEVLEEISRGGMGVVYRAQDLKLDRHVALKVLSPELVSTSGRKQRFIQEAKTAAALSHPHIGVIHEIDESDGVTFIAMELIEGDKLQDVLKKDRLPLNQALELAIEVAEGLSCAHEKGIVHRDLKPANIMVTGEGRAKIIDFGLAKLLEPLGEVVSEAETATDFKTEFGLVLGTVSHMSPEQARGEKVDQRSDIFNFGIVLYEMLTGELPFRAPSAPELLSAIMNTPAPSLGPAVQGGNASELQRILDKCLEKDVRNRYQETNEMLGDLRSLNRQLLAGPKLAPTRLMRWAKSPKIAAVICALLILVGFLTYSAFQRSAKNRWAREVAIPEVTRLVEEDDYAASFALAEEAEPFLEDNEELSELWTRMSQYLTITTVPVGADVYLRPYSKTDVEEEYLGRSPVIDMRVPLGPYWLRVENEGFDTIEELCSSLGSYDLPEVTQAREFYLDPKGANPPGMVRVPDKTVKVRLYGLPREDVSLPTYLIDKHEVTNREFREFVDVGGYQTPAYWEHEFVKQGRVLSFEEAMAEFRDQTSQIGPSTWEVGTYPEGQDDYPVSGVSWYEAAAYAKFAGKSLPSIYHWAGATDTELASFIVPFRNFSDQGPRAVGIGPVGPCGTYDMAGNIKEWCLNATGNRCFILSGAWNEPSYLFYEVDAQSPFSRFSTYGFRCSHYLNTDARTLEELQREIPLSAEGIRVEEPVSDEVFDALKSQYDYDPTNLEAVVDSVDGSHPHWIRERISFNAAYDNERVIACLYKPRNVTPPFQTVVYFPGASARRQPSVTQLQLRIFDFIIKSGRAVMYPMYMGTHERIEADEIPRMSTRAGAERVISQINDLRRSVDYLETRDDIDLTKLAYYGFSWGGGMGPIALALEDRLSVGVLLDGGLKTRYRPETYAGHFAPRVMVPILMINGTRDTSYPVEIRQKPLYELLGTPEEHKRHALFECGHSTLSFWRNQGIKEILDWLDHYFGPPEMKGR